MKTEEHQEAPVPVEALETGHFWKACQAAIVALLRGETPAAPRTLEVTDWLRRFAPDYTEERLDLRAWVFQNWSWLALTAWSWSRLSAAQRKQLASQPYDLSHLGVAFYEYLTSAGPKAQPPSLYILRSMHPESVLKDWFYRFIRSPQGPFEVNVYWKLKERFDEVLKADARFTLANGFWHLKSGTEAVDKQAADNLEAFLLQAIGPIQPHLYQTGERADPLIHKEEARRIAAAALASFRFLTSQDLARATLTLLPENIWVSVQHGLELPQTDGVDPEDELVFGPDEEDEPPEDEVDNFDADEACQSTNPDETESEIPAPDDDPAAAGIDQSAVVAVWRALPVKTQVLTATRLCAEPPWTFQRISDWTRMRLPPGHQMGLSTANDRCGKGDSALHMALGTGLRPALRACPREEDSLNYIEYFRRLGRKFLEQPPSWWMNDEAEGPGDIPNED